MTYVAITTQEIAVGESVSNSTLTKVKENFDNLDSRMTTLEGGGSTTYPPIILSVYGAYGEAGDLTIPVSGIIKTTINFPLTVTGVRILIDRAGTSGTTEIDLKFKRGIGSYTSLFSTKPSVGYVSGNDALSTNAILDPDYVDLQTGDILRLDISSVQAGAITFLVRIDYVKT